MSRINARTVRQLFLQTALVAALSACASSNDYGSLQVPPAVHPEFQIPGSSHAVPTEEVVARWWETLGDTQLSNLVDVALEHNNDVGVALANLELARSNLRGDSLNRLPNIGTSVSATDQRLSEAVTAPGADTRFTTYQAGFDAAWELDLFGRLGQAVNASRAELEVSQADLDQVYVTVAAEVARTYIQLRGAQHRLDVSQRNVGNLEQSHDLTQQLMNGGLGDGLDVQRALTQLELARSGLPQLRAQVDAAINRLSVLTGQMPSTLRGELAVAQPLPSIPPSVAVGDPVELLKRRPDIRRAERQLASSIARYNMSVADLYPRVSITGSIGFLATAFADLGTGGTLTHLVGPQISWEAFNLGRVQNRIDAADARIQGQLEVFEKTLLTSFEEVDNAMSTLSWEMERRANLRAAAEASAQSSNFALQRFEAGTDSFLDVLDAQRTQLEAEDLLARSETDVALNVISLYKALGGGWQM
ncbi:MAG: efflux transporter outer membrane subunit [Gammaproteobacteria bacterium]|nr:efflux transporter outer membrane subunit [Gammaproteobacteria bacterium]